MESSASSASTKSCSGRPVHVVVLQHGLWGNTTCVSNLEKYLRQHLGPKGTDSTTAAHSMPGLKAQGPPTAAAADASRTKPEALERDDDRPEVQILNSDVNRKALTYDGKCQTCNVSEWWCWMVGGGDSCYCQQQNKPAGLTCRRSHLWNSHFREITLCHTAQPCCQ